LSDALTPHILQSDQNKWGERELNLKFRQTVFHNINSCRNLELLLDEVRV